MYKYLALFLSFILFITIPIANVHAEETTNLSITNGLVYSKSNDTFVVASGTYTLKGNYQLVQIYDSNENIYILASYNGDVQSLVSLPIATGLNYTSPNGYSFTNGCFASSNSFGLTTYTSNNYTLNGTYNTGYYRVYNNLSIVSSEPPILVKIYDVIVNSTAYQSISKLGKWVRDSVTDVLTFEPIGSLISVNIGDTITVTNSDNTVTNIPTTYVQPVVTYNGGNTSVNINTNKLVDYMGDNEVTFQSIKYDITYEYIDESENVVNETYTYNYNYNDKEIVYGPQDDPTSNNSTDDTTITVNQDPSADKVQNSSGALSSIIDSVVGFFAQAVSGIVSGLGTVASLLGGIVSSLGNIFVDIGNIVNVAFGGTIGTIILLGFIGTIILIFLKR